MLSIIWSAFWIVGVPGAFVVAAFLPVSRRRLEGFARTRGLEITTENGPPLLAHLSRVRRWRNVCGAVAWTGGAFLTIGFGYVSGGVGYLLGAVLAEIDAALRGPRPTGARRAVLSVRRTRDYVSAGARWGPLAVLIIVIAEVRAYQVLPRTDLPGLPASRAIAVIVAIIAIAALTWLARRLVIGRAQPFSTPGLVEADEAARAFSLQTMGGASQALICLLGADVGWKVASGTYVEGPLSWLLAWLPFVLSIAAIYCWGSMRARVPAARRKVPA